MRRLEALTISLLVGLTLQGCVKQQTILIRGGTVIDGTGAPGRVTDVLIGGGRILALGDVDAAHAEIDRVIDASGRVVTPGFIDAHAHGNPRRTPAFENFIAMGATTICLGQDGSSPRPGPRMRRWLRPPPWSRPGPNVALFVGHATVRRTVMGYEPDPSPEQLAEMEALVERGMEAGCFGLSSGLEYSGGRPANHAELVAVARPVGARGGVVMSHMRSEDDDKIEEAMEELFAQCREAGAAAHISHLKIVYAHGTERAEEILEIMGAESAAGTRVTADIYPYTASYTGIGIVFPDWALPPNDYEEVRVTRREELAEHVRRRVTLRNGPEATLFGTDEWAGRTLAEVASDEGMAFEDVLIDLIPPGSASAAYFVMDEEVMERLLVDEDVMICSDGSPTGSHPRGHGAFARVIHRMVVERGLMPLEFAVAKMTGLPARTIGLDDRGLIRPGMAADVLVFDPEQVVDTATYEDPHQLAEGFDWVIVNGVVARADGEFTGDRGGRALRRVDSGGAQ